MSYVRATRAGSHRPRLCTLGFGGAAIGNLYRELGEEEASAAVRDSFAAGVRYFDTAPFYGFGLSELRLGKALSGAQPPPVISTKVGPPPRTHGPAGSERGTRGIFLAAAVRTRVRLRL